MLSGVAVAVFARGLAVRAAGGPGRSLAAGGRNGAAAVFAGVGAGTEQAALDGVLAFFAHYFLVRFGLFHVAFIQHGQLPQ